MGSDGVKMLLFVSAVKNVPIGDEQKMPGQMNTVWGYLLTAAPSVEITLYKKGTG